MLTIIAAQQQKKSLLSDTQAAIKSYFFNL